MKTSLMKAIALIVSADPELLNILGVTAKMSLQSSVFALLLGVPMGIFLGSARFPGRNALVVVNRTLMGMPPVVCGLIFYMLFSFFFASSSPLSFPIFTIQKNCIRFVSIFIFLKVRSNITQQSIFYQFI